MIGKLKMNRIINSIDRFVRNFSSRRQARQDSLRNLNESIRIQSEGRGWDAEDNSEARLLRENPMRTITFDEAVVGDTISISGSGVMSDMRLYTTLDNGTPGGTSFYNNYITTTTPPAELTISDDSYIRIQLDGGEAAIRRVESGLEIELDTGIYEAISEDGKIIIRRMFDEESNNASQDIRVHEEPVASIAHRSEDVLLGNSTI